MWKSALMTAALLALAGCGGQSPSGSGAGPAAAPTAQVSASASPSPSPSADVANLNPCQLVTQQEASQLAGVSFEAGKLEAISDHAKTCTYGGQTTNVFMVEVALAPDAATAQASWAQSEAEAQTGLQKLVAEAGGNVTVNAADISLAGADKAASASGTGTIMGRSFTVTAIYLLKGRVFVTFSDLVVDKPAPTPAQMQQQAQTVLGRI